MDFLLAETSIKPAINQENHLRPPWILKMNFFLKEPVKNFAFILVCACWGSAPELCCAFSWCPDKCEHFWSLSVGWAATRTLRVLYCSSSSSRQDLPCSCCSPRSCFMSPAQPEVALSPSRSWVLFHYLISIAVIAAPEINTRAALGSSSDILFLWGFFSKAGQFLWPRSSKVWFWLKQEVQQSTGSPHSLALLTLNTFFHILKVSQQNSSFWRLELGWLLWGSTVWSFGCLGMGFVCSNSSKQEYLGINSDFFPS